MGTFTMNPLILQKYYNINMKGVTTMTEGKERIRFDCVGTITEPHIYKCTTCDHEFRGKIKKETRGHELQCPECELEEQIITQPTQFEVVGVIENVAS